MTSDSSVVRVRLPSELIEEIRKANPDMTLTQIIKIALEASKK